MLTEGRLCAGSAGSVIERGSAISFSSNIYGIFASTFALALESQYGWQYTGTKTIGRRKP